MRDLKTMVCESFKKVSPRTKFSKNHDDGQRKHKRKYFDDDDDDHTSLSKKMTDELRDKKEKIKISVKKSVDATKEIVKTTTHKVGELHDFMTQDIPLN